MLAPFWREVHMILCHQIGELNHYNAVSLYKLWSQLCQWGKFFVIARTELEMGCVMFAKISARNNLLNVMVFAYHVF